MSSETTTAEHATIESHFHHPNYVKIWAILVALLIVSVLGSMSSIRGVVLAAAFGVAVVKAYLVARNFMHINVEKRWVPYLLIVCLAFMVILFAAVSPDVMRHSGLNWDNNAARQAVESGMKNAPAKHE
jgi:caa(3)-type oxidase subunit IV